MCVSNALEALQPGGWAVRISIAQQWCVCKQYCNGVICWKAADGAGKLWAAWWCISRPVPCF